MDQSSPEKHRKGLEIEEFRRTLRQVLLAPIVACVLLAGVLVWQIESSNSTVLLIQNSDQRIALANRIETLVVDEETGLRGYQVTSDPRFLKPYFDSEAQLAGSVSGLQNLLSASESLDRFREEHDLWQQTFAEPTIAIIRAGGRATDDDLNLTGRARMDRMRALLDEIVHSSEQKRIARIAEWERQKTGLLVLLVVLTIAIGLVIGIFTWTCVKTLSTAFRRALDLERSRAEELFQSEQNLRTTLASIGDGVITCDNSGSVQMMNPVAQDITGWTESQARGRPLEDVFHIVNETTRELVENPVSKVQRLNKVVGIANHTVLVRRDGSEVAIDDSGAPIRNEAGELIGVVMVFRDITMQRRTRAALLANEKLAVAGRLAATIAHEIHNPLDSVANLLYLLQNDPKDPEAPHFLEIAQSELARVTHISRAMLSLYRESRAPVRVDLKEILSEILLLMESRLNSLRIHVVSDLPEGVVLEGFPAELRQVFTNLLTNAAEAAGQGGTVTVSVASQAARKGLNGEKAEGAIVEITDNGRGIPPEVQEHLFQPFFTTKGEHGTGLGLWVSQGIVRKHGGILEIFSGTEDGDHRGATARIFLASKPLIEAVAE